MVEKEKTISKKYLILEDKCNVLPKLNAENVSKLLDLKVINLWKWTYYSRKCALIELSQELNAIHMNNGFGFKSNSFPVKSRMISINSLTRKSSELLGNESTVDTIQVINKNSSDINVNQIRQTFNSNDETIEFLLKSKQLTELEFKLRFFVILQLEELLCNGAFNRFSIFPFGSSLAGLANSGSDLDLVLITELLFSKKAISYSCRELMLERSETQKSLEVIGDLVQHFVPNFSHIIRILRARVPIIKMNFDLAPIEVDLSIELSTHSAHHGVLMASYLSHCIQIDKSFKHLLLFIRILAKQHGLVKSQAGTWFTSFQITAIVIFFFQIKKSIPSISSFMKKSIQNSNLLKPDSEDPDFIQLLREFFYFILSFEFNTKGMSILYAKTVSKPNYCAIYIENPVDPDLNICKNVVSSEMSKLIMVSYFALEILNTNDFNLIDILDSKATTKKMVSNAVKAKDLFNS